MSTALFNFLSVPLTFCNSFLISLTFSVSLLTPHRSFYLNLAVSTPLPSDLTCFLWFIPNVCRSLAFCRSFPLTSPFTVSICDSVPRSSLYRSVSPSFTFSFPFSLALSHSEELCFTLSSSRLFSLYIALYRFLGEQSCYIAIFLYYCSTH